MTHTDQQLYDAAVAFQAEEAAWDARHYFGHGIAVMRKNNVVEGGFFHFDLAQERMVHLRRVAAMKAALAVLEEK